MSRKLVLTMTLTIVLMSMLGVTSRVQRAEATGTIYIRANGAIEPSTANITSSNNITYTLIGNINESIVVERNNIIIDGAGYTVEGSEIGNGFTLSDANNVTIENVTIKSFAYGIYISGSSYHSISGNNITDNDYGVYLVTSSNNTVSGNNITANNYYGVYLSYSSSNGFFHNNFIDNSQQVYIDNSANVWDDGVEGNYWSNYTGVDLNHDGIGDSPHAIDSNNRDNYPLMGIFHSFKASPSYSVNVISNSTIEDFTFFESNGTIRMYVSNSSATQSFGFCRVCIPKNLMSPPYTVMINDGSTEVLYFNGTVYDNGTHIWIYFAYPHSTHKVVIVPEFPSVLILPLLMMTTLLIVIIYRRKHPI